MKKSIVAICLGALVLGTLTGCFAGKSPLRLVVAVRLLALVEGVPSANQPLTA